MSRSNQYTCDICSEKNQGTPPNWVGIRFTSMQKFQVKDVQLDECGKHLCQECAVSLAWQLKALQELNKLPNRKE
jgi:hypothetical protein